MIKKDIDLINHTIECAEGGKRLYDTLVAKYTAYDENFSDGLPCLPAIIPGSKMPTYENNLSAVKGKLEAILTNNESIRFYHKEGFWPGVISGVLSSVRASGIIAGIKFFSKLFISKGN